MMPEDKSDMVYNAILIGMDLDDAYLYAGLTPKEILEDKEDEEAQFRWAQVHKSLEFSLLTDMRRVTSKQIAMGRSDALQWQLEKFFPKYSSKPLPATGNITLILKKEDTSDITEVYNP